MYVGDEGGGDGGDEQDGDDSAEGDYVRGGVSRFEV